MKPIFPALRRIAQMDQDRDAVPGQGRDHREEAVVGHFHLHRLGTLRHHCRSARERLVRGREAAIGHVAEDEGPPRFVAEVGARRGGNLADQLHQRAQQRRLLVRAGEAGRGPAEMGREIGIGDHQAIANAALASQSEIRSAAAAALVS